MRVVVAFKDGTTQEVTVYGHTPGRALSLGVQLAMDTRPEPEDHAGAWLYFTEAAS